MSIVIDSAKLSVKKNNSLYFHQQALLHMFSNAEYCKVKWYLSVFWIKSLSSFLSHLLPGSSSNILNIFLFQGLCIFVPTTYNTLSLEILWSCVSSMPTLGGFPGLPSLNDHPCSAITFPHPLSSSSFLFFLFFLL